MSPEKTPTPPSSPSSALWQLGAAQLAAGYRTGAFTPIEALQACLDRVALCQPAINAMALLDRTGAIQAAEASRLRWASGQPLGPLDGVPISLKDNLHATGMPTSWGSRLLQGFVAPHDELPVARLRAAGAVFFGKTCLPEFAMQGYTANQITGITRNPWDTRLTPGGSSGGAAAAVAAGCGPLALATDGGGSIRRPASHCGLVGFKPSAGLVPRAGGLPDIFLDYEVVGSLGRHVQDVLDMGSILAAKHLGAQPAHAAKILFVPMFASHPVDEDIGAEASKAARQFEALGHHVEQAGFFDLAEDVNSQWPALSATGLTWMLNRADQWPEFGLKPGRKADISLCGDAAQSNLANAETVSATEMFAALMAVHQLKTRLAALFEKYDFLLTPATAALPWPAEQPHPPQIAGQPVGPRGHAVFTAFANAAGLPAISLPSGWVQGLPTGFQLIGKPGDDAGLLALALQYEKHHPWQQHWPDICKNPPGLQCKLELPGTPS